MREMRVWLAAAVVLVAAAESFTEESRPRDDLPTRGGATARVGANDDASVRTARHLGEIHATLDRIERRREQIPIRRIDGERTASLTSARTFPAPSPSIRSLSTTSPVTKLRSTESSGRSNSVASAPAEAVFTHACGARVRLTARAGAPHAERLLPAVEATLDRIVGEWSRGDVETPLSVAIHLDWHERATRGSTVPPLRSDSPYRVWITAPDADTLEHTLAHELTHVVLLSRFGESLPAWANEGIASLEDDSARVRLRRQIVARWVETGRYPDLATVLARDSIAAHDLESYAAATTLIEFLLSRHDRREAIVTLDELSRANDVGRQAEALGHRDIRGLESAWRMWVVRRATGTTANARPR